MLFLAKCKACAFLVSQSDSLAFKQAMAEHLAKSHRISYEFVSGLRISDFSDTYTIHRFRDADVQNALLVAMQTKGFWKAQRTPFSSGLASGEKSLN